MTNVAIIPARGGSTRILRKNSSIFHGRPIIEYSIAAAQATNLFLRIIVSTDSPEIAEIAMRCGAHAMYRPADLCKDEVGTQEVMANCANVVPSTMACCIYPTAPMMLPDDILRGFRMLDQYPEQHFAMSVGTDPLQDAAQFYWGRTDAFLRRKALLATHTIMIPIEKKRVCDINTPEDWSRASQMYEQLQEEKK